MTGERIRSLRKQAGLKQSELAEQTVPSDLEEELDALKNKLMRQEGLLFHGKPVSSTDLEKVFDAARLGAELILSEEGKKNERG